MFPGRRRCVGGPTKRYGGRTGAGFAGMPSDEFADGERSLTVAVMIVNESNRALPACERLVCSRIVGQSRPSLQVRLHIALPRTFVFVS